MSVLSRRPLSSKPLPLQIPAVISPLKAPSRTISSKRARSPDPVGDVHFHNGNTKRQKAAIPPSPSTQPPKDEKERRRLEREAQKEEFRAKYTKAFPSWSFYFDLDSLDPDAAALKQQLEAKVSSLGAKVEPFFSSQITHLITNQSIPSEDVSNNKENIHKPRAAQPKSASASLLKSPIKLRGRAAEDVSGSTYDIVQLALNFGRKIWSTAKLESVLDRCLGANNSLTAQPAVQDNRQRSLTRLLESERLHGISERDPTQKRHDYRYFSRNSYFVLVEDMHQELATIAVNEYPITRLRDGTETGSWPVLHCHPLARGPFVAFDERERRRYEKSLRAETQKEKEDEEREAKMRQREQSKRLQLQAKKAQGGDLRRSVSMNNLHRRVSQPDPGFELVDLDIDGFESANASGYLGSTSNAGYMAASGNSVSVTSTTGTTSTASHALRSLQLPNALRERLQQQVVTSRKAPVASGKEQSKRTGTMGPPADIPDRPNGLLKKSKSTNTLRLPKREEGSKPGYCESCRLKFDDFKTHIKGRRHRKFATDPSNFAQLDAVLSRVQRRTSREAEEEEQRWQSICRDEPGSDVHFGEPAYLVQSSPDEDETMQPCEDEEDADADGEWDPDFGP